MTRMKDPIDISRDFHVSFLAALDSAQKGDRIIYHVGPHCGGSHRRDAAGAAKAGLCLLFCKRAGEGQFAYLAVKR
ncbi:hypothetical protein UFOVP589_6 [uncultured Caudovirales phage]|uniref:Uncharacterized protein n=1 Tax=uncultured Caudovirales phage TaxID=2100421 RepID=A0A6J5MXY9_9CAUD|nr:hypothetical protein UFOVP589_6 [uncultured Caudovirales phage]